MGVLSIVQLLMMACGEREAMVMIPPLHMTQQYRLASMAAWLSSTGISHHDLFLHIPSIQLSTVNSSPHPGISPQSLNSSSQLLPFQETHVPAHVLHGFIYCFPVVRYSSLLSAGFLQAILCLKLYS